MRHGQLVVGPPHRRIDVVEQRLGTALGEQAGAPQDVAVEQGADARPMGGERGVEVVLDLAAEQVKARRRVGAQGGLRRVDPAVPLADQVGALAQLRDEGKVDRIGLPEVDAATLAEARRVTEIVPWRPIPRADPAVAEVAAEIGLPPASVAQAWLQARSPVVRPIPGTTSPAHLRENMGVAGIALAAGQFARIGRPAR